jgi:hypothetical protein
MKNLIKLSIKLVIALILTQFQIANSNTNVNGFEESAGLMTRITGLGLKNLDFELNGGKKTLSSSGLKFELIDGVNSIRYTNIPNKVTASFMTLLNPLALEEAVAVSKENVIYFNYSKGDVYEAIFSGTGVILRKKDSSGKFTNQASLVNVKTKHTINLKPDNAVIILKEATGKWETEIYNNNNSEVIQSEKINSIPVTFNVLSNTSQLVNFTIKWGKFNEEKNYSVKIEAGVESESTAYINNSNSKYLDYQLGLLPENKKTEFICINGMHEVHKSYDECTAFFKKEADRLALLEKEKKLQLEYEKKLATNEGALCSVKFKSTTFTDEFNKCYDNELVKTASRKKFADAVASPEGSLCSTRFKFDNANFWSCFDKNLAESNAKKKQQEAIEFEEKLKKTELANLLKRDDIARQCVEIGFEMSSPPYKECYLKLKLHTEQIAEWRKLQTALQNQTSQQSQTQSGSVNYGGSASPNANSGQVEALLGIAQRGLDVASGQNRPAPTFLPMPPPPMQIITPRGNSYSCSMMGASMRCR